MTSTGHRTSRNLVDVLELVERQERDARHHPERRRESRFDHEPGERLAPSEVDGGAAAHRPPVGDDAARRHPQRPGQIRESGVHVGVGGALGRGAVARPVAAVVVGEDRESPAADLAEHRRDHAQVLGVAVAVEDRELRGGIDQVDGRDPHAALAGQLDDLAGVLVCRGRRQEDHPVRHEIRDQAQRRVDHGDGDQRPHGARVGESIPERSSGRSETPRRGVRPGGRSLATSRSSREHEDSAEAQVSTPSRGSTQRTRTT